MDKKFEEIKGLPVNLLTPNTVIVNLSHGKPYYDQRNNRIDNDGACNVESYVAASHHSAVKGFMEAKKEAGAEQIGDRLMHIMRTDPEILYLYNKHYSDWGVPPNQVHALLPHGLKKLIKSEHPVTKFSTEVPTTSIIKELVEGRCVVASTELTGFGHIVPIVGFVTNQTDILDGGIVPRLDKMHGFIIDDTWGNIHGNYAKNTDGNNVFIDMQTYNAKIRKKGDINNKWAHIFNPKMCDSVKPENLIGLYL